MAAITTTTAKKNLAAAITASLRAHKERPALLPCKWHAQDCERKDASCAATATVSHGDLDVVTTSLARGLRKRGVRQGDVVAVALEGNDLVFAYVAVLKAGAIFCPLGGADFFDDNKKAQRVAAVLGLGPASWQKQLHKPSGHFANSSKSLTVKWLTLRQVSDVSEGVPGDEICGVSVPIDDPQNDQDLAGLRSDPRDPVHIIFTSGTSRAGEAKAVMCDHLGSLYSHEHRNSVLKPREDDIMGAALFGIWDVAATLLCGGATVMLPSAICKSPRDLATAIEESGVTRIMLTPSLAAQVCPLLRNSASSSLREVTLCGEKASADLVRRILSDLGPCGSVVNLYSLSEAHDVAMARWRKDDVLTKSLTDPLHLNVFPQVRVQVSDQGELVVCGDHVALGYYPGRTDAAGSADPVFSTDPDSGIRCYQTGDAGTTVDEGRRIRVDGRLESSKEIKVHGFRVDLDVYEQEVLAALDEVRSCAVLFDEASNALHMYVVPLNLNTIVEQAVIEGIRHARIIPLPSRVVLLDSLPCKPGSGKLDVNALVDLGASHAVDQRVVASPSGDDLEMEIAQLMAKECRVALVTGACGFLGAPTVIRLVKMGWKVYCLSRQDIPSAEELWTALSRYLSPGQFAEEKGLVLAGMAVPVRGRLRDLPQGKVHGLPSSAYVDCVIHLAGRIDAFAGYAAHREDNVEGTRAVLEYVGKQRPHPRVVLASSSAALPPQGSEAAKSVDMWPPVLLHRQGTVASMLTSHLYNGVYEGYAQSKWVVEQIFADALGRGLEGVIVRASHIAPQSALHMCQLEELAPERHVHLMALVDYAATGLLLQPPIPLPSSCPVSFAFVNEVAELFAALASKCESQSEILPRLVPPVSGSFDDGRDDASNENDDDDDDDGDGEHQHRGGSKVCKMRSEAAKTLSTRVDGKEVLACEEEGEEQRPIFSDSGQTRNSRRPSSHVLALLSVGLWFAVKALLDTDPSVRVVIYAREGAGSPASILERAGARFGVKGLDTARIDFLTLQWEHLLEAKTYPRLTLLGQSLGSIVVGAEALSKLVPDVFVDTIGYAFTYPLAWACGCRVVCYTHYPTMSTDMLDHVWAQRPSYNNDEAVAGSVVNSRAKYLYYRAFCLAYWVAGRFAEVAIVNSSWTKSHIDSLWGRDALVVFPPCGIDEFQASCKRQRDRVIVSLGQFRPEKDHRLQIRTLAGIKARLAGGKRDPPRLVLYGSCRNEEDQARVEELRAFAARHDVGDLVEFELNVPFEELKERMGSALLGIHTMWNEHFGIALVEMMAAGVILVAHDSGGPKADIVRHGETGYLASSVDEYVDAFMSVLDLHDGQSDEALDSMRTRAQESLDRFSEPSFLVAWTAATRPLLL
ncbi:GDP-Man:Man3GlcNAc2-PP-Dol alpha-1,2-mannosyltransferase [Hondaea fermentalgiana]|uniref:GDP-Man:Man(3)GlcNAc(2)-PP-Dol alpha-1,2-mannosyltransferase n=1 Tax=Hondaea fermentalgiana TaxID=2315210 RepID=A0A2R5G2J8_9STRA|nr:GDP-Man:Man3GlcNAc2-PP-Dol alpha-1,2-mannosyltransferase [Hondaea fermentalgiana]|eukprot:GBG25246.1 GDP-Man:Man3GlcNAc2-PP-Dol alpha-1,2-mannosyltransferase [Hondaea fermentalgiana]